MEWCEIHITAVRFLSIYIAVHIAVNSTDR